MNVDPTTLLRCRKVCRAALMSVFAHNLPNSEPFRRACNDLEDLFQLILDFIPNQACFPVHAFRLLCRLRRLARRWTALIPRVIKPPNLPGLRSLAPIIHCPNPWAGRHQRPTPSTMSHRKPQAEADTSGRNEMKADTSRRNEMKADTSRRNEMKADTSRRNEMKADSFTESTAFTPSTTVNRSPRGSKGSHTDAPNPNHVSLPTTTNAPLQTPAQSAAHSPLTTSGSPLSIPQALRHERRQAWRLALPLPYVHPRRPKRTHSDNPTQNDSGDAIPNRLYDPLPRSSNRPRRRPWIGWKEFPGPKPETIPPSFTRRPYAPIATLSSRDLRPDANTLTEFTTFTSFTNSTMSRRNEMKAEPGSAEHQLGPFPTGPDPNRLSLLNPTDFAFQTAAQGAAMLPADNFRLPAPSRHAARTTHHEPRSGSSLLQSPSTYQRALDSLLLQIVTTLTRAIAKTNRLYRRDPDPKAKNHPDHQLIQPAVNLLEELLRERLEAFWFHTHNSPHRPHPPDAEPPHPAPSTESTMSRRSDAKADASTPIIPATPPPEPPDPP